MEERREGIERRSSRGRDVLCPWKRADVCRRASQWRRSAAEEFH